MTAIAVAPIEFGVHGGKTAYHGVIAMTCIIETGMSTTSGRTVTHPCADDAAAMWAVREVRSLRTRSRQSSDWVSRHRD